MARSVLRVADQVAGLFPDRCVLSGVETERAVRLTATQFGGPRWLLGVQGFATVVGCLPGHGRCPVALPVSVRVWKMWRIRNMVALSTLAAGATFVVWRRDRRRSARRVRPGGRRRRCRLSSPGTSQLLGHLQLASFDCHDRGRTDPSTIRRRRPRPVHPDADLKPHSTIPTPRSGPGGRAVGDSYQHHLILRICTLVRAGFGDHAGRRGTRVVVLACPVPARLAAVAGHCDADRCGRRVRVRSRGGRPSGRRRLPVVAV